MQNRLFVLAFYSIIGVLY